MTKKSHLSISKDGEHVGYVHKDFYNSLKDLEPIFGKEVYKTLSKIVKHKHGDGSFSVNNESLPDNSIDNEEVLEVLSSLVNKAPDSKKKKIMKTKSTSPPPLKEETTGLSPQKEKTPGIQKWSID